MNKVTKIHQPALNCRNAASLFLCVVTLKCNNKISLSQNKMVTSRTLNLKTIQFQPTNQTKQDKDKKKFKK